MTIFYVRRGRLDCLKEFSFDHQPLNLNSEAFQIAHRRLDRHIQAWNFPVKPHLGNAGNRHDAGIIDRSRDFVSLSLIGFLAENQTEFMNFHYGILDSVRAQGPLRV